MSKQQGEADALARFTEAAVRHRLIRAGDKLDQNVVEFARELVEMCAVIGDGYSLHDEEANAGEHIRAVLGH